MVPNFVRFIRHVRGCAGDSCHSMSRGCGPGGHSGHGGERGPGSRWFGGGGGGDHGESGFGVRRPLRFLAHRLGLEDAQIGELARILDDLKTERAQASVDQRRTTAIFADLLTAETFDGERAAAAASERVASAKRVGEAITAALARVHAVLTPAQRSKLAMLMRGGILSI